MKIGIFREWTADRKERFRYSVKFYRPIPPKTYPILNVKRLSLCLLPYWTALLRCNFYICTFVAYIRWEHQIAVVC